MKILLTNDDGIRAPGIVALYRSLTNLTHECDHPIAGGSTVVFPVAPLTVQSATSHGVTFHEPLMVSEVTPVEGMAGVGVDGRPADCVKLAISSIWPERFGGGARPDLLISGMNAGANVGINVIYSGTVAAALEAAFLGVPSIAVSLRLGHSKPRFDVAARHAREVIERLIAAGLPSPHECLSINLPITSEDGPTPEVVVCPMNTHGLVDKYERRVSPGGDVYYWAAGHGLDFHRTEPGTDVDAVFQGRIAVTPLLYDLTRHGSLDRWRGRLHS